jgi:hypothetical protein
MNRITTMNRRATGHTLMELVVAMSASAVLLGGLGSVMFIASQAAYTPSAATSRIDAAEIVNQIANDLRYATLVIQQTPQILEFVVADRNGDGTAEKIRYDWSGIAGAPLRKTINGNTSVNVLDSVNSFSAALQQESNIASFTTTTDSAEQILGSTGVPTGSTSRTINANSSSGHWVNPFNFPSVPANALYWNLTRADVYGSNAGTATLLVQVRPAGDPNDIPTSNVLGQTSILGSSIPSTNGMISATFATPVRELSLSRKYDVVWCQSGSGSAAKLAYVDTGYSGVVESDDAGASWQYMPVRQMFCKFYGTYTTPGTTYNVTRNYVSHVTLALQVGTQSHSRIDASIPLQNVPELVSTYWRADFDRNPTTKNTNGDSVADFAAASGTFDPATLIGGIWYASGALETRPLSDFTTTTVVEARCRNTSVGGLGAVVQINADRQSGHYAPLLVYVKLQSDGTQTLTLLGRTSDSDYKQLFTRQRLPAEFIRFRLTILPQSNAVNLTIKDEDQGTFTYPTYAPTSTTDRYMMLYGSSSLAEFDYVDVRVGTN